MNVDLRVSHRWSAVALAFAVYMVASLPAWAQVPTGAIEGAVRDESGAVLPGVTVEVSSPALLEGTRTTVTEATGNYQFLRLPVGAYMVRFSLPGFGSVQNANVLINASFTATINAVLKVGALEETLTVTGASPLVDVRTSTGQVVVTSEVVNTIPSSRHIFDMAKFVLGASTTTPDVGGSTGFQFIATKIHGSRSNDRLYYIDGVSATGYAGSGDQPFSYGNTGAQQELDYQTTAIPAWYPVGGVTINTVTKSGGNRMSGDLFVNSQAYQSSNLDDRLRGLGVRATSGSKGSFDLDGSLGGPIVKDRLWFFVDSRTFALDVLPANQFNVDNVTQADDFTWRPEFLYKASLKVNDSNRFAISNTTTFYDRPARRAGASFIAPEATYYDGRNHENHFTTAIWTGTHGSSWLYEVQFNDFHRIVWNSYNSRVGPNDVARLDIVKDLLYGAPTSINLSPQDGNIFNGSVTRVVNNWFGSHQFRTGVQSDWGHYATNVDFHGDIILRFRSGVPDSVDIQNTPTRNDNALRKVAVYFQDAWRIDRLTINAGLRYDYFHTWIPEQSSPAGTFTAPRSYPFVDVMTWKNLKPRFGIAYDVTGDAKTVVKGSVSEYVGNEAISLASAVNPMTRDSNRCAWTDSNNDLFAQASEISRCAGFPNVNTRIDPNLPRPNNREYNLGIQRQISANWAASLMYFRRENTQLRATRNLAVPFDSYIPVVITNPLDNSPLTIFNQNPNNAGQQNNILTTDPKLNDTFNGIEFGVQRRFSADAFVQGGYAYGRDRGRVNSAELNDPNNDINAIGAVGPDEPHQLKLSSSFRVPGNITVGAFLQAYSGHPKARTLSVSRTLVPTLTRATQNVPLEANDAQRYDPIKLVDLRLGRPFKIGTWRFEVFADAYNLLNANTVISQVTTIGTSLGNVSDTLGPRLVKVGGKFSF